METEEAELCFPNLHNSSCIKPQSHTLEAVIVYVVTCLLSLLTIILNLLVIISIAHFRQLHSPTNLIILSLAVSDFFIGLVVVPVETFMLKSCWIFDDFLCLLYFLLPTALIMASITSIILISVDRYIAICNPMHYHSRITVKSVSITICLCWVYSICFAVVVLHENYDSVGKYKSCQGECVIKFAGLIDLVLGFFIPISIIIVLYMQVFVVAVFQARAMRSHVATLTLYAVQSNKYELKAARNLGIVVLFYLMCYCPYCIVQTGENVLVGTSFEVALIYVMYVNSCINPIIYAFLYPWFRIATKTIVTFRIFTPGSRDLNII